MCTHNVWQVIAIWVFDTNFFFLHAGKRLLDPLILLTDSKILGRKRRGSAIATKSRNQHVSLASLYCNPYVSFCWRGSTA